MGGGGGGGGGDITPYHGKDVLNVDQCFVRVDLMTGSDFMPRGVQHCW